VAVVAERLLRRADDLAVQAAIANRQRVDERLLMLFGHLARRYGRVTGAGLRVDVPLTHAALARMVGAHRPSVSSAVSALRRSGVLLRPSPGTWLLTDRTAAAALAGVYS
jgi:CRP-like cAMP-binding protein